MNDSKILAAILLSLVATAGGCTIPISDHPVTDNSTSVIDERLIGHWEFVPDEDEPKDAAPRYAVGRVKARNNTLEMTYLELDKSQRVQVKREPVYCSQIAGRRYLSVRVQEEKETGYLLMLYRFTDKDTIKVNLMNAEVVGKDIEAGNLKGVVKRSKRPADSDPAKPFKAEIQEVHIKAVSKEIAAYLKGRGEACFILDKPLTLRRVNP